MTPPLLWWIASCSLFLVWVILRAEIKVAEAQANLFDNPALKFPSFWYIVESLLPAGYVGCAAIAGLVWLIP